MQRSYFSNCSGNSRYTSDEKIPQIRIMENAGRSPFVIGAIKEILVLPDESLSEKDMHYILKHEMLHLKRKD